MDKLPPDPQSAGNAGPAAPADMVAAQIKRELQAQAAPPPAPSGPERPAAADPGFAFNMRMRAGGNELTDSAEEFRTEHGAAAAEPPPFSEGGWGAPAAAAGEGGGGGAIRILLIVLVVVAVGVCIWQFGLPLFKKYQEQAASAKPVAKGGKAAALDPVSVDAELEASLATALAAGNAAWKKAGLDAYVYRYSLTEAKVENVSQTLTINGAVGGKDAAKAAGEGRAAFDGGMASFTDLLKSHPGVASDLRLLPAEAESTPEETDKYLFYGYDYGREHMNQLKPVISALAQLKKDTGSYPRLLTETLTSPKLHTAGGFKFVARGFGYVPLFKTDGAGNIVMGAGDSTLDRMSPQAVSGYYLFLFLGDPAEGLDVFGHEATDYYTRKIAPLPYDTAGAKLQNVPLKPDGTPDGIGCVVKDGVILPGAP